ncbi:MAG: site-2 protease family protein [Candidatus Heimdallarchaeota archaeon]|nr:MAG: site-2 protease family protein [Candidatus Heimdallarchaeota archaeon]
MKYSYKIISINGIDLNLHITFIALFVLLFLVTFPQIYSVILFGLLFISVTVHELAHSLLAKRNNLPVNKIVLYPIGGAAQIEDIPDNPSVELKVAAIGPVSSLVIGVISLLIHFLYPLQMSTTPLFIGTGFIFFDIGSLNLILAIFNLIPAFPMDGGRVLRASLTMWKKDLIEATKTAASIGRFFALIMIVIGFISNLWLIIIGFFIYWGAAQELQGTKLSSLLKPLRVGDFMLPRDSVMTIAPTTPVSQALEMMFHARISDLVVCQKGELLGVITWNDIIKMAPEAQSNAIVADLMVKPLSILPNRSVFDAYKIMAKEKTQLIPVIDDNAPCNIMGVITSQSIAYGLAIAQNFKNQGLEY